MVCLYGMSERLGPLSFGRRESAFLGDVLGRPQAASEATAEAIDAEVASIVREAYAKAKQLLTERRKGLVELAQTLESEETLEGEKLKAALASAAVRDVERRPIGPARRPPKVQARAWVVVDMATGAVLGKHRSLAKLPQASTMSRIALKTSWAAHSADPSLPGGRSSLARISAGRTVVRGRGSR